MARDYTELTPEELDEATKKLCVLRAKCRDLEAQLRGHVRATRDNIVDSNGIHVEVRQSRYVLVNPGLAALAVCQDLFPPALRERITDNELLEVIEDRLPTLFRDMLLDYNARRLNKIISALPGQDILNSMKEDDPNGGVINKNGAKANLAVRYSPWDSATSHRLRVGDPSLPEFDDTIDPHRLTDRLKDSKEFLNDLPDAPIDDDEEWGYDEGLRTRDFREAD